MTPFLISSAHVT